MNTGESEAARKQEKKALRRYWDAHPISTDSVPYEAGTPESFEAIYANWKQTIDEIRLEFLESCRGRKILEVGCGIALDGRFLTENEIDYTGLDYSFRSLGLARKHFDLAGLRKRFVNGDAVSLPFADDTFGLAMSIGVIHHIVGTPEACRELVRVTAPGGTVRVMFYNKESYHYALVQWVVRPLIWLMLRVPALEVFLRWAPEKYRHLFGIAKQHGLSSELLLATSADTSFVGRDNFIPRSGFWSEREMRELFDDLEDCRFLRTDLKYYPLPFLRSWVERRWGFFLTMSARKPAEAAATANPAGSAKVAARTGSGG